LTFVPNSLFFKYLPTDVKLTSCALSGSEAKSKFSRMQLRGLAPAGVVLTTAMVVCSLVSVARAKEEGAPPRHQLKAYELHGDPRAADISPDGRTVATQPKSLVHQGF
jgi:hypothetical protein